jgi:hypothetical protein
VAEDRPGVVLAQYPLTALRRIRLNGQDYKPRYVSFAKEPPRREERPDHGEVTRLSLEMDSETLEVDYRGVFGQHLGEVAAHTLHNLKAPADPLTVIS